MVFVNIIASLILGAGLFVYRFVYPKKKINVFALLLLILILPVISITRTGAYQSGDFDIHIYRTMAFYGSLSEGHFMPSWAENLNATYGYPLFIFNYVLPYYIISLFHFIGLSYISSMKLFLALSLYLSGIFMYIMAKEKFKDNLSAFTSAIFYTFVPYHLISVHFKITIGEVLSFTIIPVLFIFINRLLKNKDKFSLILSGFFLGLLGLSHIFIAIIMVPILFVYILFYVKPKTGILYFLSIFGIGALITFYQWLPPILYNKYLFIHKYPIDTSALYYPTIKDLLYAPWRFGLLFQGPKGQISDLIGYAQLFVIGIFVYLLFKKKIPRVYTKEIIAWLLLFLVLIFFITPYSKIIWIHLPLISDAGTQRLLIPVALSTSILAGFLTYLNRKRIFPITLLILFAIFSTILNWGQRTVIPQINDSVLSKNLPYSTSQGEGHFYANTGWANPNHPWFSVIPLNHLEILKGIAKFTELKRISVEHEYIINSVTPISVNENTLYFPGWSATDNKKPLGIRPDKNGVITFTLPKGKNLVILRYNDLYWFSISKIVSGGLILIIILFSGFYLTKKILYPKVLSKH